MSISRIGGNSAQQLNDVFSVSRSPGNAGGQSKKTGHAGQAGFEIPRGAAAALRQASPGLASTIASSAGSTQVGAAPASPQAPGAPQASGPPAEKATVTASAPNPATGAEPKTRRPEHDRHPHGDGPAPSAQQFASAQGAATGLGSGPASGPGVSVHHAIRAYSAAGGGGTPASVTA